MSSTELSFGTESVPRCYLCGAEGAPLHVQLPDILFGSAGKWNLSRCPRNECGLIWLSPRIIESDVGIAYKSYYTHGEEEQAPPQKIRFRNALYTCYQFITNGINVFTGLAAEKARLEQMFLDDLKPGRLLDVGCGDGKFLSRMKSKGWSVDGCDFDAQAIQRAATTYSLKLRLGPLESQRFEDSCFDAVTLSHVIEHLYDPIALIREVRRILKPNGRIVLVTPNASSWGMELFGSAWRGLEPPRHIHILDPRTIAQVLDRAGFVVKDCFSTAANADIILGCSMSIEAARESDLNIDPSSVNPMRAMYAFWCQQREFWMNKRSRMRGEEVVAIGTK